MRLAVIRLLAEDELLLTDDNERLESEEDELVLSEDTKLLNDELLNDELLDDERLELNELLLTANELELIG